VTGEDGRHCARLVTLAFVRNGADVLLLRHPDTGDRFAGLWNGIGGHVEAGEGIREAARRELREEAGLDVDGLRLGGVVHESGLLGRAHVLFVFVGEAPDRELHPREGLEVAWHAIDGLEQVPLVGDVAALLPRVWTAREPLFATEGYDGGDRRLWIRFDEEAAGVASRRADG
jgi:8-oxo-dGTP diphosphatase